MYGGRAIDSFDRRILTTYMDEYLGDFIFDTFQPFHFFRNKEVDYKIPVGDVKDKFVGELFQGEESSLKDGRFHLLFLWLARALCHPLLMGLLGWASEAVPWALPHLRTASWLRLPALEPYL